jgi:hypothetical protein
VTPSGRDVTSRIRRNVSTDHLCDLLAALMILAALIVSIRALHGLEWPYDPDHFRDLAFAQTARDGHPLADPSYRGEWIWYNPLLTWLVAALSVFIDTPLATVHVQSGPFLNLLGPIGFYGLAARLVGRPGALLGLTGYLFGLCRVDCWACSTYSPWLFTSTFAQGVCFIAMLVLEQSARDGTVRSAAWAGAAIGTLFLTHTAPALLVAALAATMLRPARTAVAAAVAAAVASPFLLAIVGRYHLHVVNSYPLTWLYGPVMLSGFPATLRVFAPWIVAGLAGLLRRRNRMLVGWLVISAALTIVNMITPVVPAFHFFSYTLAALLVLGGGLAATVVRSPLAAASVAVVATVLFWPTYLTRQDFTLTPGIARSRDPNFPRATRELRRITTPDEVVLGTYGAANLIIGPAGRKVIAPDPSSGNPYVSIGTRVSDRDAMLAAIMRNDTSLFDTLAAKYDVSAVVAVGPAECDRAIALPQLTLHARFGNVCVSTVNGRAGR